MSDGRLRKPCSRRVTGAVEPATAGAGGAGSHPDRRLRGSLLRRLAQARGRSPPCSRPTSGAMPRASAGCNVRGRCATAGHGYARMSSATARSCGRRGRDVVFEASVSSPFRRRLIRRYREQFDTWRRHGAARLSRAAHRRQPRRSGRGAQGAGGPWLTWVGSRRQRAQQSGVRRAQSNRRRLENRYREPAGTARRWSPKNVCTMRYVMPQRSGRPARRKP